MKKNTKAWSMKMRLALLALAALVWIAVPVSARAEGETVDTWDGTAIADGFAAGDGTQDDPFQIETAAQLAHFAKTVNEGEAYLYKYIVLTADIDLANKEWTPIGNHSNPFKGNFNGDNHTVTGMQISGELDRVGLFGECTKHNVNSAIKNITVKDSVICGINFVGAIVGYAEEINIENCRSIGNTINGKTDVGGICGKIGGYSVGKVSQCYNSSKVTGRGRVGGIAGMGGIAENCLNTGEIMIINKAYQSAGGGIFGIFDDTTASASITACVNLGKVSGGESFGGIVGSTDSKSTGHISNCYYNMDAITGGFDAGTALTAGQLCGALPDGLDSTIWKEGSVDTSTAKATQGRFGTATGTYINLTKVADIKETKTGQSKAKGIFYLVSGKGLKIAITYIDVLGIKILHRIPEILRGRIILNIFRNSIAELTTGINFYCQDIYRSSAALLAALPYIEHSLRLIPVDPLHIHDITHIQHNDRPGKCIADITKNFFLRSCQQITAFRSTIILVFSCGSAENHNRQIRLFRRLSRQFFADGHFFLVPGLHGPSLSYIKRMILQPFPVLCLQYLIHLYGAVFLETVCNIGHIWSIDHTSGTRTALIMLELGSAEDRHPLPFLQRQHTVFISKQYASLRRHTSCQFRIFLIIQCIFHISVCSLPVISIFLYLLS